jgi:hypothetical protein
MSPVSYPSHERTHVGQIAAIIAATVFLALGLFQLALAVGAPLGHAAWGGDSARLTAGQRIGSAISIVVYAAAAAVVLARAGITQWPRAHRLLKWGPWLLAILFALSALANFASASRWENLLFGPAAVVLAILCVIVARIPPTR